MSKNAYERLAVALDTLPNGFAATPARTELKLLEWIFSPDEAYIASHLTGKLESADVIARRVGLEADTLNSKLIKLVERRFVWKDTKGDKHRYRLAPFVVGIYEAQMDEMDHEFAHLFEKYMADGGAAGIMKYEPAIHRVIPAHKAVKSEWILPYDDVKAILMKANSFRLNDCICRVEQEYIGRRCDFPIRSCLTFSSKERPANESDITKPEALAFLDHVEEIGLVHTVSNTIQGIGYVCDCCGCCCAVLRGITDWGIANSVAHANYYSSIDPDKCTECGTCIERCQVNAISEANGIAIVDPKRCIGCGLCVTRCPSEAAELTRKQESEIVHPPIDYATWEKERTRNRGLEA